MSKVRFSFFLLPEEIREAGWLSMRTFKVGDHVQWNSEAGIVSGTIVRKITADTVIKGYIHHVSREQPQYIIKSDKTDHLAVHKGTALKLLRGPLKKRGGG